MSELLLFLDTETTGLYHATSHVIDIWAELRQGCELTLIAEAGGHVEISAEDLECASPEALRVNRFSVAAWRDARPWVVVWSEIERDVIRKIKRPVVELVGSNPAFDLRQINAMHARHGTKPSGLRYSLTDTVELAKPLRADRRIDSCRLATLADYFGLPAQDHTARGDVKTCVDVYRQLMSDSVMQHKHSDPLAESIDGKVKRHG